MKTESNYLNGWIRNGHMRKNGEPQRSSWGTQKKKKKQKFTDSKVTVIAVKSTHTSVPSCQRKPNEAMLGVKVSTFLASACHQC